MKVSFTGRAASATVAAGWLEGSILSDSALRVGLWISSHTPEYLSKLSQNEIAKRLGKAWDTVNRALEELERHGIVERTKVADPKCREKYEIAFDVGRWTSPPHGGGSRFGQNGFAISGEPPFAISGEHQNINEEISNTEPPPTPPGGSAGDDGFDAFWAIYPRHEAKKTARERWAKMSEDDRKACLELTALWLQFQRSRCPGRSAAEFVRYLPHPAVYLNNRRWEDEVDVTPETGARARAQAAWRERRGK